MPAPGGTDVAPWRRHFVSLLVPNRTDQLYMVWKLNTLTLPSRLENTTALVRTA